MQNKVSEIYQSRIPEPVQQFCKEWWTRIPPQRWKGIASHCECLIAVIAAKRGYATF